MALGLYHHVIPGVTPADYILFRERQFLRGPTLFFSENGFQEVSGDDLWDWNIPGSGDTIEMTRLGLEIDENHRG